MTNLVNRLLTAAAAAPERPALRLGEDVTSYAQLEDAARRVATLLTEAGFEPGDRACVMLPNVPEFAQAYYGILLAGGAVVPTNPLYREREIVHYVGDSGASVLLAWHEVSDAPAAAAATGARLITVDPSTWPTLLAGNEPYRGAVDRDDRDTAVVLYTSGTTGRPKGAELTHANLRRNADVVANDLLGLSFDDVLMGCLPLYHSFGQTAALNAAMFVGASLSLLPRFNGAQALQIMQRDRVTVFLGVPTMYSALLEVPDRDGYDLGSLRACVSGGAALPVEVLAAFERAFGCVILEGYGLSETSPVACFNRLDARRPGTVGLPIDGVEIRLLADDWSDVPAGQPGEIAIRGHNVMKGYWNLPAATAEVLSADGWFRTGDIGALSDDGFLSIVDRKKSLIIRGGLNIYPREIEEVLYEHPEVREAAVVGMPDPALGEEVAAVIVRQPGATVTESELKAFTKQRLAAYKYPRRIFFTDALPTGPTGKVLKREITIGAH